MENEKYKYFKLCLNQRLNALPEELKTLNWKFDKNKKLVWARIAESKLKNIKGVLNHKKLTFEVSKVKGSSDCTIYINWQCLCENRFIPEIEKAYFQSMDILVRAMFKIHNPLTLLEQRKAGVFLRLEESYLYIAVKSDSEMTVALEKFPGWVDFNAVFIDEMSPLYCAVQAGCFQAVCHLCEVRKVDLNLQTAEQCTALHIAAHNGDSKLVNYLVARGAKTDLVNCYNETPLIKAIGNTSLTEQVKLELVDALADDIAANIPTNCGDHPLYHAIRMKSVKLIGALLRKGAVVTEDALNFATSIFLDSCEKLGVTEKGAQIKFIHDNAPELKILRASMHPDEYYTHQAWIAHLNVPFDEIPEEFICPISLRIMNQPVYSRSESKAGTFDCASLTEWLKTNTTHPVTRNPLTPNEFIDDLATTRKIEQFIQERKKCSAKKNDVDVSNAESSHAATCSVGLFDKPAKIEEKIIKKAKVPNLVDLENINLAFRRIALGGNESELLFLVECRGAAPNASGSSGKTALDFVLEKVTDPTAQKNRVEFLRQKFEAKTAAELEHGSSPEPKW